MSTSLFDGSWEQVEEAKTMVQVLAQLQQEAQKTMRRKEIRKDQEQQCPLPRALCNNSQFLLETTILALTLKGQVEMPAACFHHCTPTCSSRARSSRGAVILWATLIQHLIYKDCHELSHTAMYVHHAFMSTYVRDIIHKWHVQCLLMLNRCLIVWDLL